MWYLLMLPLAYLWLRGHWFARVIVFVGSLPAGVLLGGKNFPGNDSSVFVLGTFCALFVAGCWLFAGLPTYWHDRHRIMASVRRRRERLHLYLAD